MFALKKSKLRCEFNLSWVNVYETKSVHTHIVITITLWQQSNTTTTQWTQQTAVHFIYFGLSLFLTAMRILVCAQILFTRVCVFFHALLLYSLSRIFIALPTISAIFGKLFFPFFGSYLLIVVAIYSHLLDKKQFMSKSLIFGIK